MYGVKPRTPAEERAWERYTGAIRVALWDLPVWESI